MATIIKRPNGTYQARVYIGSEDGKKKYAYFSGPSKKEAVAKAREFEVIKKNRKNNNITVGEAIDSYINTKSAILSPATVRSYRAIRRNKLKGIMDLKILTLSDNDIQIAVNQEALCSSSKTVRNIYGLLSASLKVYNLTFNIKLPQKVKPHIDIPTDEEVLQLLEHSRNDEMFLPILLASTMGLRRSEICALQWSDVDLKNKTLNIDKALVPDEFGIYTLKTTKTTSSTRVLPIPSNVASVLEECKKGKKANERIIEITPQIITQRFRRMVNRITGRSFSFHSLRHFYASTLMNMGIINKISQKLLGHSTDLMLKNVYQHIFDKTELEAHQKIDSYFDDLLN